MQVTLLFTSQVQPLELEDDEELEEDEEELDEEDPLEEPPEEDEEELEEVTQTIFWKPLPVPLLL